jgi:hypothetical protein
MAVTITKHQNRSTDIANTAEPGSRVDARAGRLGLTEPRRHWAGSGGARSRVMAWPAAGYGVVAAAGPGGDEDEQA